MPSQLDEFVRTRADHRCEYCQASEWLTGQRYHVDHILPRKLGGETVADNLCLACPACNAHKRDKTEGVDPVTNEPMPLFNPRTQRWRDHFAWRADPHRRDRMNWMVYAMLTYANFEANRHDNRSPA